MKVLLLSGSGWLGSYITREFVANGDEVTILARGNHAPMFNADDVNIVKCDRADPDDLREKLRKYASEVVIDVIPGYFRAENSEWVADALDGRIKHYLHCSSTGVYTPLTAVPGNESEPVAPLPENGDAFVRKAASDKVIMERASKGFPATVIQPTCIMGPGMRPMDNIGGRGKGFLKSLLDEEEIILPDGGRMLLQFVHPADLARAFRLAAYNDSAIGQTYIISGQKSLTLRQYIATLCKILGRTPHFKNVPSAKVFEDYCDIIDKGDFRFFLEHMSFDITKARNELGYEPQYSLEAMLKEVIEWTVSQ